MHVILFFGPKRLHLSLFCHTLCLLNSLYSFPAIDRDTQQPPCLARNPPFFWQNSIHTDSYLDRQSPREPLVVATQPELSNEPAHLQNS